MSWISGLADLVLHRVFLPLDRVAGRAQPVAGHDAERRSAAPDRTGRGTSGSAPAGSPRRVRRERRLQRQVSRQREDAGERLGMAQRRMQRDARRPAKIPQSRCAPSAMPCARSRRDELPTRTIDSRIPGSSARPSAVSVLMSYQARMRMPMLSVTGLARRVREHEAQARRGRQLQLRHDRHEVVAVGAEAVQPDDARRRLRRGRQDDGVRGFLDAVAHGLSSSGTSSCAACPSASHSIVVARRSLARRFLLRLGEPLDVLALL